MRAGSSATAAPTRDFVFVRHGETDWNREKRVQGSKGAPMNPAGHEQAKGLARVLWEVPIQAIYSSALPRAVETASYVAGPHRVNVQTDPRLNEIHHGDWEGLSESELPDLDLYKKWREDPTSVSLPGAEPLMAVHDRAVAAMKEIAARHPASEGLVAIVSHQIVLALLKCYILDRPWNQIRRLALSVASYEVLTTGEGFAPRP
ncbi:MAG TPA: histidine phosphatase family protein [Candidatus Polarisedimenticolia bacterium]|nr:histidine phosphatase family protein [Candidatus Polarisedimenticolia bacterium]